MVSQTMADGYEFARLFSDLHLPQAYFSLNVQWFGLSKQSIARTRRGEKVYLHLNGYNSTAQCAGGDCNGVISLRKNGASLDPLKRSQVILCRSIFRNGPSLIQLN